MVERLRFLNQRTATRQKTKLASRWSVIELLGMRSTIFMSHPGTRLSRSAASGLALLPTIPEGQNYLWHTERGGGEPLFGWRRRYWSFLLKLAKDLPSWTIQAQPGPATGPFHWDNRRLSVREMARMQTFPDNVVIKGEYAPGTCSASLAMPCLPSSPKFSPELSESSFLGTA